MRLPKEFRFEVDRVFVEKSGQRGRAAAEARSWDAWLNSLEQFSSDFLQERDQPTTLDRREPS